MATTEDKNAGKPKDINFTDIVVDIQFHPEKDVIASGSIEGEVFLHSYTPTGENSELMKLVHHKKSCRVLRFSPSGEELHTGSKDKSINTLDLNTGSLKRQLKKAHEEKNRQKCYFFVCHDASTISMLSFSSPEHWSRAPIYSMLVTGENFLVTGDDDGHLKLWDLRQQNAVMELKENAEFISDIAVDNQKRTLLTTSGDGTLTAFSLRRKKMELQSELFDSEFLSLAIIKRGEKVVCGCGDGELNIFNWSYWGNISDRFPGHPMSIDCMVALSEDTICTGSCDGMIRAVNIQPNRFLGVVGEHPGDLPVENLAICRNKQYLASCSHDQKIKFWNVDSVKKEKRNINMKKRAKHNSKNKFLKSSEKGDFFADMAADDNTAGGSKKDDEGDSDDDNEDDDSDDEDSDSD